MCFNLLAVPYIEAIIKAIIKHHRKYKMANGIKSQSTICDNEHPTEFVCAVEAVSQSNEEEEM